MFNQWARDVFAIDEGQCVKSRLKTHRLVNDARQIGGCVARAPMDDGAFDTVVPDDPITA